MKRHAFLSSARLRRPDAWLRLEELESRLAPANQIFTVPGDAGAQNTLTFTWTSREAAFNNEIGVYVVQDNAGRVGGFAPDDSGYAQAALANSQVVFSSGQGAGATRTLTFTTGDRLAFYLVQNGTTANARTRNPNNDEDGAPLVLFSVEDANPDDGEQVRKTTLANGATLFSWEDQVGSDRDFNDVVFSVGSPTDAPAVVPGTAGQSTPATFTFVSKEAAFAHEMGVFVTDTADGRIGGLTAGDAGYARAVLASTTRQVIFSTSQGVGTTTNTTLPAGASYGFYLISNGSASEFLARNPNNNADGQQLAFFSFAQANPDGREHFRFRPGNTFVWEDQIGGDQDFNDLVGSFQFTPASATSPPPASPPPASPPPVSPPPVSPPPPAGSDTTPPAQPTFDLSADSDTNVAGDQQTSLGTVTLVGTTEAGAQVQLVQPNLSTTADANGRFTFTNVALNTGPNTFTVRATDAANNSSQADRTFTRVNTAPVVSTAIADVALARNGTQVLDLAGNFSDADTLNTIVRANTSGGPINIELLDRQAPRTVANFLNYINSGRYTDAIFHRSAKLTNGTPFVLQGGGFSFKENPSRIDTITTDPAVLNEPDAVNRSNVRGTVAMAKLGGDPNSATDQFFFNLGNNASILDGQNGGFTVFGRLASAADQQVVDNLAALPTQDQSNAAALPPAQRGVFNEIPLTNYTGTNFPTDTARANYALINTFTVVRSTEGLTYTATSDNAGVATVAVANNRLTVQGAGALGTANITVTATDRSGATVNATFRVTVS